ncbi:MAG: hypothetical protein J6X48_10865 [Lachnospiraceae bacterium]|nr:hypothetical protein [Lachnospiraceae bacterium]
MKKNICYAVLFSVLTVAALTGCGEAGATISESAMTEIGDSEVSKDSEYSLGEITNDDALVSQEASVEKEPEADGRPVEDDKFSEEYAGITLSDALDKVKVEIGSGGEILEYSQGEDPDGNTAWVIVAAPVTTADGPTTVSYYVNDNECIEATPDDAASTEATEEKTK